MNDSIPENDLSVLTADIVAAYVSNNTMQPSDLPGLIADVHSALSSATNGAAASEQPVQLTPAVPVKKSVQPDFIVCLEDGKQFKSLKRHLSTRYGMTPAEYRAKWGLPSDYPMVAPNYAAARSALAKSMGLGNSRRKPEPAPAVPAKKAGKKVASALPSKTPEPAKKSGRRKAA